MLAAPAVTVMGGCSDDAQARNRPPALPLQQVITDEDVPIEIRVLDAASDEDGDALRVVNAGADGHGVEILGGGVLKVTPMRDFAGMFVVRYRVTDGVAVTSGLANVVVRPVNDPPIVNGGIQTVHGPTRVVFQASDVDGDALTYEVVSGPGHGTLTGDSPVLEYEATAGFVGEDTITFRARDAAAVSEPATITFSVVAGTVPFAQDGRVTTREDEEQALTLFAIDLEADRFTYTIETRPQHGTLRGDAPNLIYTPERDFSGEDSLRFFVTDTDGSSSVATVSIGVFAVNDAPVAGPPQTVAATEDTERTITLEGSDVDGPTLSFHVQGGPSNGTIEIDGATARYRPNPNYHGPDSFSFAVFDSEILSPPVTVTIEVASVEDLPAAQPVSRTLFEDNPDTVALRGSDGDGDPLTFTIGDAPQHGSLSGNPSAPLYTPDRNYNGPDRFTYTVSDGDDTSAPATVNLQVTAVDDRPVASDVPVATDEDTDVAITLQATDIDSPTLTFRLLTLPAQGTITGSGANLSYRPARDATEPQSFTFRVSADGDFDDGTVTIDIRPVNDPPTTADDFAFTEPGAAVTFAVVANDSDVEGDAVELHSVDAPAHGSVDMIDGQLQYTPDAGFTGVDVFAYTAIDAHGDVSTGNAHVGVGTFPPGAPTEAIATIRGTIIGTNTTRIPAISEDGRYVVFSTAEPLIAPDTNLREDVYVYDRGTRAFTLVSVDSAGNLANNASFQAHLAANGRHVVFSSFASNLVAGDDNGQLDVFRHDRQTGETIRISVATGGGEPTQGQSQDPEVSDDGNLVVFRSNALGLIASDTNGAQDIFVRDVAAGTTARVSVTTAGGEADLLSIEPTISGNGRYVAFTSDATNLVADDTNGRSDVFVRDLVAGVTTRVSVSSVGGQADSACTRASLSRDGNFVSFLSAASNLVGGTPSPAGIVQVYVRNVQQQTTVRSASTASNALWARLSGDGRYVTSFNSSGVSIRDRFAGGLSLPSGSETWMWPMISGNGRYVVALDTSNGGRVIVTPNTL